MPAEPSGVSIFTPKLRDEALVRKFVSLNGKGYVAISIQDGATPLDPDDGSLALSVWFNDPLITSQDVNPYGTVVATITSGQITKADIGKYFYNLGPGLTANRGLLTAVWTYLVGGVAYQFIDHLQIMDAMPLYDTLTEEEKSVVEQVTWMFGDLYDSTEGGPHLIEEFQTHWGYERIAQMMRLAVHRMNFIGNFGNTPTTWSVGSGSTSVTVPGNQITTTVTLPNGTTTTTSYSSQSSTSGASGVPGAFAGLTVFGTYIECMRHFRDSYTELPNRPGMDATYTDRRDYWSRWSANLQAEQANWEMQVKHAKMSLISMSRGSLLVAGGIYGGSASGIFRSGTYSAQVRSARFYPAAYAIGFGAVQH